MPLSRRLRRSLDRPAGVAALAALAWLAFFLAAFRAHEGDLTRFIVAGDRFVAAERAPAGLHVLPDSSGYDGQFFYRLALDPLLAADTDFGIELDVPAYRHQRILYPLLAHGLALGRADRVPAALVGVNLMCAVALAALGAALARRVGRPAWLGLAFSLYPGFLLTMTRDLGELTALTAGVAGLLLLRSARPRAAAGAFALAVLARETQVLLAGAAFLAWLPFPRRRPGRPPAVVFWLPGLVFLAWQLGVAQLWNETPLLGTLRTGAQGLSLGWLALLSRAAAGDHPYAAVTAVEIVGLLALLAGLLASLPGSTASRVEKAAALAFAGLLFTLGSHVWVEDWSFLRVSSSFGLLALLVIVQGGSRAASWAPAAAVAAWPLLAWHVIGRL